MDAQMKALLKKTEATVTSLATTYGQEVVAVRLENQRLLGLLKLLKVANPTTVRDIIQKHLDEHHAKLSADRVKAIDAALRDGFRPYAFNAKVCGDREVIKLSLDEIVELLR